MTKGLLVSEPGMNAIYAIRCAVPNYSWAQHLADAKTTGTCQNMHLAAGTEAWDFVVLQARGGAPGPARPGSAAAGPPATAALTRHSRGFV